jgi:nucleoside-diphosphate-sugar epimerase
MMADEDCATCGKTGADTKHKAERAAADSPANRVVVTGASGFIGKNLLSALSKRGYKLRVLARDGRDDEFFRSLKAEIYTGDLRDPEVAGWLMDGASGLINLASIVRKAGLPDSEFWELHVHAVKRLMEASVKCGVSRVVHVSTTGVMGDIKNPPADEDSPCAGADIYQVTKAEGELAALEYNGKADLEVAVVRPAMVYGPGDMRMLKLFRFIANGKFRMIGDGKTLAHPVYIDDLVDGIILAYESKSAPGRVYIIGGEKYVTLSEWVGAIAREAGVTLSSAAIPRWPVMMAAIICEAMCRPFKIEPPIFRRRVDFFVKNRAFSIERAKAELGYTPKTGISDGAKRTLEWYRERGLI